MTTAISSDDDLLRSLSAATARELEMFCAELKLTSPNERDHLARCCKRATARLAGVLDPPPPALSPYGYGAPHGWVGLGTVDVVLRWKKRAPTFLELKCGAGTQVLRPCIWDAVKLSTAVLGGNAASGYLLAGAPTTIWQALVPGADLFASAEWVTLGPHVRERFLRDWRKWELEPHIPGRVAIAFRTVALGSFPLEIAGTPWEVRLARVEPIGDEWVDWPSVL